MTGRFDNADDSLLAAGIRKNDKEAFKALYDRYSKKIYYFSLRYTGVREESEELVQSVFINLWEHRKSLDENLRVKSYIYRSAINYIKNYLKKKAVCARFIEAEMNKTNNHSDNTFQSVLYHDLENSIDSIIKKLPPQQQKIFKLSRFEGMSNKEISDKLDLSVRTVENQLYRVLKMLRSELKEEYFLWLLPFIFYGITDFGLPV